MWHKRELLAAELAQRGETLAALPDNQSSIPTTQDSKKENWLLLLLFSSDFCIYARTYKSTHMFFFNKKKDKNTSKCKTTIQGKTLWKTEQC